MVAQDEMPDGVLTPLPEELPTDEEGYIELETKPDEPVIDLNQLEKYSDDEILLTSDQVEYLYFRKNHPKLAEDMKELTKVLGELMAKLDKLQIDHDTLKRSHEETRQTIDKLIEYIKKHEK